MPQSAVGRAKEVGEDQGSAAGDSAASEAKTVNVSYRLTKRVHTVLKICSFLTNTPQNDLAEMAIEKYIEKLRMDDPKLDDQVRSLESHDFVGK
jgi:hypothetical protein